jgi:hypothetical protein
MKQTQKHTPGPWQYSADNHAQRHFFEVLDRNGFCIYRAEVYAHERREGNDKETIAELDRAEANARLVAAAPNLLEALVAILDAGKIAGVFGPCEEAGKLPAALYREGRAAITKATGQDAA